MILEEEVVKQTPGNDLDHSPSYNDDMWQSGTEQSQEWKSKSIGKLAASLVKAQSELKGAQKNSTNPFFKSKYADLHAVIEASFPALNKYGLSVVQGNRWCNITNGFYITTLLLHESGEWIKSEVRVPISGKKNAQDVGSAITYGRRYGLSAICGIAQYDDDGNAASGKTGLT
jgi:hypothetical protein